MNESQEIEVYREPAQTSAVVLWGTDEPRGMTARMTAVADAMAEAVRARGMAQQIDGREYVRAEGWALVGAMVGIFPRTASLDEIREDGALVGFRATTELVSRDGSVVGGAVALCTRDERMWANRDWNQIASMAQTRANAKAYRQSLGFIMPMAGYAPTPAEEMDGIGETRHEATRRPAPAPRPAAPAQRPPVNGQSEWWPRLMTTARERGVKNSQISTLVSTAEGLSLQAATRAWLNEHTSGDDTAEDFAHLLDNAAGL